MRRILLIVLLFPMFIEALGSNGQTHGISAQGSDTCAGYVWQGGIDRVAKVGIRISFYDLQGKKLGNTIDVWNRTDVYSSTGDYNAKCEVSTISKRFYKCVTSNNVFFVKGTPSRINYVNKNNIPNQLEQDSYTYYVDRNYAGAIDYNPLSYTRVDTYQNAKFKNYFTTPEVVAEYIKLAKITGIDTNNSTEYLFLLEPVVKIHHCTAPTADKIVSSADFAYFFSSYSDGKDQILNCDIPKSLSLVESGERAKVGKLQFQPPLDGSNISKEDRTTNKIGVGMYLVYGDQVCKNCTGKRDPIVYHTISLSHPFLDINGKIRTLDTNSNWHEKESTIDVDIYKKNPQYTVVLTPNIIKQIRTENKNIKYSELSTETFEQFKKNYASIFK